MKPFNTLINHKSFTVTALVKKIHVKIYKTTIMGHIFQVEWWGKHPNACSFGLLCLGKLAKAMAKPLESHEELFGIYL